MQCVLATITVSHVLLVLAVFAFLLIVAEIGATRRRNQRAIERMRSGRSEVRW